METQGENTPTECVKAIDVSLEVLWLHQQVNNIQ
jgi:hypothetical protein